MNRILKLWNQWSGLVGLLLLPFGYTIAFFMILILKKKKLKLSEYIELGFELLETGDLKKK